MDVCSEPSYEDWGGESVWTGWWRREVPAEGIKDTYPQICFLPDLLRINYIQEFSGSNIKVKC